MVVGGTAVFTVGFLRGWFVPYRLVPPRFRAPGQMEFYLSMYRRLGYLGVALLVAEVAVAILIVLDKLLPPVHGTPH